MLNLLKSNQKVYQILPNDLRGHPKNFWRCFKTEVEKWERMSSRREKGEEWKEMERIDKKLKENGKEPKYKKIDFDFWFLFWFYILKNQKNNIKIKYWPIDPPNFFWWPLRSFGLDL
jgi:hypothetical protein